MRAASFRWRRHQTRPRTIRETSGAPFRLRADAPAGYLARAGALALYRARRLVSSRRSRWSVSSTRRSGGNKQLANMLGDAAAERTERVTAFEGRDDAALRVGARRGDDLARHPGIVGVGELQAGERIFAMRIEAGRNVYQLGTMLFQRGQPVIAHRCA